MESNSQNRKVSSIDSPEGFKTHLHNVLSVNESYDKDTAEQLAESLLTENNGDVQFAIKGLTAFINADA